jgi:cytoskeletal protein CcmA (bactofilin family)
VTVTDATNSAHVLVTDNESTNEENPITFVENATTSTGNVGLEMDGDLTYNPSTGRLTATQLSGTLQTAAQANITSLGTLTTLTVDNVIINGSTIGHTGDTDLMTVASGVLTVAGEVDATSLDISGDADIDGTLEADAITVNGTALGTVIAGTTVTLASTVTVTDSTANTNFPVVFHDESNALLDDTGALRYNPSTGELLVPKLTVAGTTTTVDTVTMNAQNAIVFEGATADAHETTLTIVDPTADRTINLPNVSGTIPVLAAVSTTQITSTPEELNILDGVTSTAAELNILDGVTATAAELNILDGATVVVGEINALDLGSTAVGTAIASKAVILDSNKDYTGIRNFTITGEIDAATGDFSGDVDVDGTLEADAITVNGTALNTVIGNEATALAIALG